MILQHSSVLTGEQRVWPYGSGTVLPPPSYLVLDTDSFRVLTVELMGRSYAVGYSCAPSLPLETAVFSYFDGGVEGMVLRVLYCCAPSILPGIRYGFISRLDGGVDGMFLWGRVLLCPLSFPLDTSVFSFFDGGVEGMVPRGRVLLCLLPPC